MIDLQRYWNKEVECMNPSELKQLQNQRLVDTVTRMYQNTPYYRKKMDHIGLTPADIRGIDDLHLLPFTTKTDLRDNYPFNTFAVPLSEVVRVHASSGTTGKSTVVGYTAVDITTWDECVARCLVMAGGSREDIIHVAYGYGLFTGGLGLHGGSQHIGALTVPASGGNTARQIQLMVDFGATILCCTPSYALYLADAMKEAGVTPDQLKLRAGIFGAEPWTQEMKQEIEDRLGLKAFDIYGLSEIMGPGVSMSCECNCGLHVNADHFIPEIINPDTGEVLPDGEKGELVFTCITKQALPLLRYRTRDLSVLYRETCACGRTQPRMEKVTGRSDDMLIIRGVNVFPSQIESVLLSIGQLEPHYMLYVDRKGVLDILSVEVEMSQELFSDEVKNIEALEKKLHSKIESILGISADVRLVAPKTLPRSEGKAKRVIDRRNLFNK